MILCFTFDLNLVILQEGFEFLELFHNILYLYFDRNILFPVENSSIQIQNAISIAIATYNMYV